MKVRKPTDDEKGELESFFDRSSMDLIGIVCKSNKARQLFLPK